MIEDQIADLFAKALALAKANNAGLTLYADGFVVSVSSRSKFIPSQGVFFTLPHGIRP